MNIIIGANSTMKRLENHTQCVERDSWLRSFDFSQQRLNHEHFLETHNIHAYQKI